MSKFSIFPLCGKFTNSSMLYFFPTSFPSSPIFLYAIAGCFFYKTMICGKFDFSSFCRSFVIVAKIMQNKEIFLNILIEIGFFSHGII